MNLFVLSIFIVGERKKIIVLAVLSVKCEQKINKIKLKINCLISQINFLYNIILCYNIKHNNNKIIDVKL